MRSRLGLLALGVVLAVGCTQDFDAFSVVADASAIPGGAAGRPDASSAGGAAAVGQGAAAGRPDASSSGSAGSNGQGAAAGAPDGSPAGGAAGGGAAGAAGGDAGPCPTGQKRCGAECVSTASPEFGCAAPSCAPCSVSHATAGCDSSGACSVLRCDTDFVDCNGQPADGCEINVSGDPANCGACGRACASSNVASIECASGRCNSTCDLGWANCNEPFAPAADDGCELDVRHNRESCGACGNSCTAQNDMLCGQSGTPDNLCGCANDDARCQTAGGGGNCLSNGTCQCQLGGGGTVTCRYGEVCVRVGTFPNHACRCNAGPACAQGQVCCQTPAGCTSLLTDVMSCGACGRACPPGFSCNTGRCGCTGAASCSRGTTGICNMMGRCVCGGMTCGEGQRCLPSGDCG